MNFLNDENFFKFPLDDYQKSQRKSFELDKQFGFDISSIEKDLAQRAKSLFPEGNQQNWGPLLFNDRQAWVGLDPKQLQTPYNELYFMLNNISPKSGQTIIDLGAGYGRMGLVVESMFKDVNFIGHEFLKERVDDGNRVYESLSLKKSKLFTADLIDENFQLEKADFYFMYDFGKKEHIKKVLDQLFDISKKKDFRLIARGRGCRGVIQYHCPWLSQVFDVQHFETFSIYSSFDWTDLTISST